ncbi:MAG: phospholipase D-like domain-containing protein [Candidatus Saccharimonadales bacterium]
MRQAQPPVRVLAAKEYVAEATRLVRAAQSRIVLFTMIMTYDAYTEEFFDALCGAAQRGIPVEVAGDIFTLGVMSFETDGQVWNNSGIKSTLKMRERLEDAGAHFSWVGQLGPILYAQRTHLKWCIIDDAVFCFGGVNLYKNGITSLDYMLLLNDAALANRLVSEHERLCSANRSGSWYKSFSFDCTAGRVLVDGGIIGRSLIYRRACELAAQASDILYISQYPPGATLVRSFAGKQTRLYYNRWQQAFGMNKMLLRLRSLRGKWPTEFRRSGYIHAKCIIFTMPDGQKVALSGTHNFERGGVLLGTREIALETDQPELIEALETYARTYISSTI